jgi:hypothetical protein
MPVSPGAGFGSDGTNLQVGGLWISPAGIAWAVGTAGHLGRVQSSASSGNWQDVTLPASMTSWTPRRVYGFGSTLVVLTATNGAQFTLWAQLAGVWTNLAFPDPMTGPPLVAVESATSIYIADPATNRSWHWNGNGWRAIRLDSPTGPSLSLSIVTAALDGTTYGRMASDSATASYRLRDGVATRMPWPHNIADFGGRAIRVGVVANPDALLREVPLHGAYRLVRPINCPQADAGEYADLIGISSGPDGKIWFTAAAVAFANTLTGLCRFVTYTPR